MGITIERHSNGSPPPEQRNLMYSATVVIKGKDGDVEVPVKVDEQGRLAVTTDINVDVGDITMGAVEQGPRGANAQPWEVQFPTPQEVTLTGQGQSIGKFSLGNQTQEQGSTDVWEIKDPVTIESIDFATDSASLRLMIRRFRDDNTWEWMSWVSSSAATIDNIRAEVFQRRPLPIIGPWEYCGRWEEGETTHHFISLSKPIEAPNGIMIRILNSSNEDATYSLSVNYRVRE